MDDTNSKSQLLQNLKDGLAAGMVSAEEVQSLLPASEGQQTEHPGSTAPDIDSRSTPLATTTEISSSETPNTVDSQLPRSEAGKKLTLVDVLFYLAGGVLYASLMVMAIQAGADSPLLRTFIMLASGLCLWTLAFIFGRQNTSSENREGFVSAMVFTGSLALISGGVMAATSGGTDQPGYSLAVTFLCLGALHLYFDRIFRHNVLVTLGMFLLVAAFPTALSAMLRGQDLPMDIWTLIGMGTGVVAAAAGYVASRTAPGRDHLRDSFLSIAAFFIMGSVYAASVGSEAAVLWSMVLPVLIYGAFYISIKRRSKNFLVTGSFFLVMFVITIAFKYFSGIGAAFSLLVSATALLATAFMASSINRRYIKNG